MLSYNCKSIQYFTYLNLDLEYVLSDSLEKTIYFKVFLEIKKPEERPG